MGRETSKLIVYKHLLGGLAVLNLIEKEHKKILSCNSFVFTEFLLEASEKIANDYDKRIDVRPLAVEYNDGIEKLRYLSTKDYLIII